MIVDFFPSRLQQFLAFGETLAGWQEKFLVPVIRMPAVGVSHEPSPRLEEASVCIDNVAGARPAAQQGFVGHAHEDVACGILIADEEASGDQRLDESQSLRRARDFGAQGRTCRNRFITGAHRGEGTQHDRQLLLDVRRERVDDFVGAARDRPFETAKCLIRSKGQDAALPPRLVQSVEHKFEKRQRSGIGSCRLLQHIVEPSPIGTLLEAEPGGARRLADDLGDLRAGRRQELIAAEPILQPRETGDFAAAVKEIRSDRRNHPSQSTAGECREKPHQHFARCRLLLRREQLLHLIDGNDQSQLRGDRTCGGRRFGVGLAYERQSSIRRTPTELSQRCRFASQAQAGRLREAAPQPVM